MMQTKFLILLSFVFTLSLTPLWTACSNEDVPVPVEEPEEEPGAGQVSGSAPLVGTVWFCDTVVNNSGSDYLPFTVPEGSYVCLLSNGTVESDMPIFPEGTKYIIDHYLYIVTPAQAVYTITVIYSSMMGKITWLMFNYSGEAILVYLNSTGDSQSQGENNHGGGTVVPVGQ